MQQPRTYPHGVTSWIDTEQPDVDAAARFYGELFGWQLEEVTPAGAASRYLIARLDGQDVAGLGSQPAAGPPSSRWNTYVAVDDAESAADRFGAAGGTVTSPPRAAGEGGVAVTGTDPAGNEIRLWQARGRPGAQLTNAPGTWNFSDLHVTGPDVEVLKEFYAGLFGWEFADVGFATMIRRPGYGDHLASTTDPGIHERQAAVGVPPGFADAIGWIAAPTEDAGPGWQVTFTVTDRDDTVQAVGDLGGVVLGTDDNEWTRSALVRDEQGALFTVSEFLG